MLFSPLVEFWQLTKSATTPAVHPMSVTVEQPARLSRAHFHGPCAVGAFTYFAGKADVFNTTIGRFCSIAPDVTIGPGEHPIDLLSTHPFAFGGGDKRFKKCSLYQQIRAPGASILKHQLTTIGSDVWIGTRAYLAQGITVGHGTVIAAHAVVTHDVEPYAVVAGVPARVIRMRFEPAVIEKLLELKWWDCSMTQSDVGKLPFDDINACIETLSAKREGNNFKFASYPVRICGGRWYQRWWQKSVGTNSK